MYGLHTSYVQLISHEHIGHMPLGFPNVAEPTDDSNLPVGPFHYWNERNFNTIQTKSQMQCKRESQTFLFDFFLFLSFFFVFKLRNLFVIMHIWAGYASLCLVMFTVIFQSFTMSQSAFQWRLTVSSSQSLILLLLLLLYFLMSGAQTLFSYAIQNSIRMPHYYAIVFPPTQVSLFDK